MREIKFRAWDKRFNNMWSWDSDTNHLTAIVNGQGLASNVTDCISDENMILMQFTGLHDKNGKEIYEGDIVCHIEDVVVEVIEGYGRTEPEGIFTEVKIPDIYIKVGDDLPDAEELEVIGNIYETPNLTK